MFSHVMKTEERFEEIAKCSVENAKCSVPVCGE